MQLTRPWPVRVVVGHPRTAISFVAGLLAYVLLPPAVGQAARAVLAWDIGALLLLVLAAVLFANEGSDAAMAEQAKRQEEGEWTMFSVALAGVAFSFVALTDELPNVKDLTATVRHLHVALVSATLALSWLVTHVMFALRYAHEYYTSTIGDTVDAGLEFPGDDTPDYWDFLYFSLVLGMTFQVSDVQITSRKLRRLATLHGLLGFLFNTVIVALTVNIAASLMG